MNFEETKRKVLELLSGKDNRIIAIDGVSGAGKTRLVKELQNTYKDKMLIYSVETFVAVIIDKLKKQADPVDAFTIIKNPILVIEDIDYGLLGKHGIQKAIAHIFEKLLKRQKIIVTGFDLKERIPDILNYNMDCLTFINLSE